jgi:hypothetical protein
MLTNRPEIAPKVDWDFIRLVKASTLSADEREAREYEKLAKEDSHLPETCGYDEYLEMNNLN